MRMLRVTLSLLIFALLLTACHRTDSAPAPAPVSEAAAPAKEESAPNLTGQLNRIEAEGGNTVEAILDNWEASIEGLKYAMLEKNPTKYVGTPYTFYGKIVQIQERGNYTWARLNFGRTDIIWVEGRFSTAYLKNQNVYVVGYLAGTYSYTSEAGWKITIPAFAARTIFTDKERKPYDDLYFTRHGKKALKRPKSML